MYSFFHPFRAFTISSFLCFYYPPYSLVYLFTQTRLNNSQAQMKHLSARHKQVNVTGSSPDAFAAE
jgi:hypothetical protein